MSIKKKGTPRSPRAPSRSLEVALSDARKVYDEYGHGAASKPEIAKALGTSAKSSSFRQHLFTVKEFGLLDSDGSDFEVCQLFLRMKSSTPDSAEFKSYAMMAIEHSPLLAQLLMEFKGKLPSRESVATRLETQRRFGADRAREVADVLEGSLRFAGVVGTDGNILPVREVEVDDAPPETQDLGDQQGVTAQGLKAEVPLELGRTVTVFYPADMTSDEAAKISNVVKALVS
jgi:hypothetical protein